MTPQISIIHATRGRPQKAAAAMALWLSRALNPDLIEYSLCVDESDESRFDLIRATREVDLRGARFAYVESPSEGSARAWDFGAKFSSGDLLVQAQDDVEPPQDWDEMLSGAWIFGTPGPATPVFVAVSDGYRGDRLCCTAIMNRARYKQTGEFLHPGYFSVFSDDDVTYRAYRDQRDGKCEVVEARDLVFLHRHHYHDKSVPMDATYERENSSAAYAIGSELFHQRNPDASKDGIKTWY